MHRKRNTYVALVTAVLLFAVVAIVYVDHGRQAGATSDDAISTKLQNKQSTVAPVHSGSTQLAPTKLSQTTSPAVVADRGLAVIPSTTNPGPGDEIAFSLYENSGTEAVNAVQAELRYDSASFSYLRVDPPADFSLAAATDTSSSGVIRLARATTSTPLTGQHLVAVLHFKVAEVANGGQSITLASNGSYIIRAADSANILQTVTAATLYIQK